MLEDIHKDFVRLVALYEGARDEADSLRTQLDGAKQTINSDAKQIAELKQQIESLKLASAFKASSVSSVEAREKVARLIREVDRCISLLEQ